MVYRMAQKMYLLFDLLHVIKKTKDAILLK